MLGHGTLSGPSEGAVCSCKRHALDHGCMALIRVTGTRGSGLEKMRATVRYCGDIWLDIWLVGARLACHRPPKVAGRKGGLWAACGLARGPAERNSVPGIVCHWIDAFVLTPCLKFSQRPSSTPTSSNPLLPHSTPRSCYVCPITYACRPPRQTHPSMLSRILRTTTRTFARMAESAPSPTAGAAASR